MNPADLPTQPITIEPAASPLWRRILPFALVGCIFWAGYFWIGSAMARRNLFVNDLFFNSDTARIARDMTVAAADHRRSNVHPLFILFVNPAGVAASWITGSTTTGAVLLNSFTGGLSVALAGIFLLEAGIPMLRA